jgi:hypothetical protein
MIRISVRNKSAHEFCVLYTVVSNEKLRDIEIHDQKGRKNLVLKSFYLIFSFCSFEKISYTKNEALFTINLNFFL